MCMALLNRFAIVNSAYLLKGVIPSLHRVFSRYGGLLGDGEGYLLKYGNWRFGFVKLRKEDPNGIGRY